MAHSGSQRKVIARPIANWSPGMSLTRTILKSGLHPIEEFKPDKNDGEVDLTKDAKGHPPDRRALP